jgi:ribonucleoside-diphosphate reductase alpha chain
MNPIKQIKKRDGRIVPFDQNKITEAIWNAAKSVGGTDKELAKKISNQVAAVLEVFFKDKTEAPTVEQIQDLVEKILIENGHAKTAKAYILYRQKQNDLRDKKAEIIGEEKETIFSLNALKVMQQRYLLRDEKGNIKETPEQLFRRVAHNIAKADLGYGDFNAKESEETFYNMMMALDFLPNSPTLMNAGTKVQQLAACFVLPIEDSVDSIFDSLKKAALIHQTGGGTGFNFSKIRPRGDISMYTQNLASGPVSFIKVFDTATNTIKQGGKRRGANMGILNVDHPDILEFISCKEKEEEMPNFNISVGITDKFMEAIENDEMYDLIDPYTGKKTNSLHARSVFELIVSKAWSNGEPGVVFLDRIEESNPTPDQGEVIATNPCGEQPLLAHEACNLGSINVANYVKDNNIDWDRLKKTVKEAIHFLDNTIDMSDYKLEEVKKVVLENRKIGLGIMGFADLLYKLEIPYNSDDGINTAEKLMKFIQTEGHKASQELAKSRGSFPNFDFSFYPKKGVKRMRNATVTTIAPTGTISMIAETSPGIEPLFALVYTKHVLDGSELLYVNKLFEKKAVELNIYSQELMRRIAKEGSIKKIDGLPDSLKRIFVVTSDIRPEWHVRMQASFQKHTDNAVSKTINFPATATIEDVKKAYLLTYKLGCKGITIYRDRSRRKQVMTHLKKSEMENATPEDQFIDNQASLPFNTEAYYKENTPQKNSEEVIPPPIKDIA